MIYKYKITLLLVFILAHQANVFRFVDYNPTSLEKNYRHELLTEHDLGVHIDLINPETYKADPNGKIINPASFKPFIHRLLLKTALAKGIVVKIS